MTMTEEDKKSFATSTLCHICGNALGEDKVQDHNHLSGRYRGAAHNQCNLDFQLPKYVPIVFHNQSGYDAHLFVKELGLGEGRLLAFQTLMRSTFASSRRWETLR